VSDWKFAQKDVSEELAQPHHFSFKKQQGAGEVCFAAVREAAESLSEPSASRAD
jgi:hypothetical protein